MNNLLLLFLFLVISAQVTAETPERARSEVVSEGRAQITEHYEFGQRVRVDVDLGHGYEYSLVYDEDNAESQIKPHSRENGEILMWSIKSW